jgi:hypothetical protein
MVWWKSFYFLSHVFSRSMKEQVNTWKNRKEIFSTSYIKVRIRGIFRISKKKKKALLVNITCLHLRKQRLKVFNSQPFDITHKYYSYTYHLFCVWSNFYDNIKNKHCNVSFFLSFSIFQPPPYSKLARIHILYMYVYSYLCKTEKNTLIVTIKVLRMMMKVDEHKNYYDFPLLFSFFCIIFFRFGLLQSILRCWILCSCEHVSNIFILLNRNKILLEICS